MNFTLIITASPEFLQAIENLTGALALNSRKVDIAPVPFKGEYGSVPQTAAPVQNTPNQASAATPVYTAPAQNNATNISVAPAQQDQNTVPQNQAAPMPVVPTTAQTYTFEQLAVAATQLNDAGRRQDLVNLLGSFGVQALTMLPKEQYGAFATRLRAMGAKI